jgi:PAS domain S-box-containing protein
VLLRWRSLSTLTDLSSPFLIELKARSIMVDFIEPVLRTQLNSRNGRGDWSKAGQSSGNKNIGGNGKIDPIGLPPPGSDSSRSRRHGSSAGGSRGGGGDDDAQSVASGASEKQSVNGASTRSGGGSGRGYVATTSDIEAAAAGAEGIATIGDAFARVDELWSEGARTFNSSPIIDVFAAQYLGGVRGNTHLERLHLKAGANKAGTWSVDVRFFAYQRQQQLIHADMDASSNKMTVERRMELEDLLELSRVQVDTTRTMVLAFWEALAQKRPDLSKLQHTGLNINNALADTDATFKRLMTLAPQSANVMRAYADFLLELSNDPKRGVELLNDAEQIEDEQSRAHATNTSLDDDVVMGTACTFDLAADSLPMLRVSSEPESVGIITNINGPAQKLLGYTARELVGRDVATIIPEPIASIHNRILERYIDDGRERMMGTSRVMFFQQRSGVICPVIMSNAKSITGDEWFSCAEEIRTNWSFVFFGSMEQSWAITGLCKSAQAMLGIDPLALRGGGVTLSSFVDDVEDLMAQCEVNPDKSVLVTMHIGAGSNAAYNSGKKGHSHGHGHGHEAMQKPSGGTETLVSARLQSFYVPFLEHPFFILKFKKATEADKAMMMMGKSHHQGSAQDEDNENGSVDSFPRHRGVIGSPKRAAGKSFGFGKGSKDKGARGKVSFGKATAVDENSPMHQPESRADEGDTDSIEPGRDSVDGGDDSGRGSTGDDDDARQLLRPPTPPHAIHSLHSGRSGGGKGFTPKGDISACPFFNPSTAKSPNHRSPVAAHSAKAAFSAVPSIVNPATSEPASVTLTSAGSEGCEVTPTIASSADAHDLPVNTDDSQIIPGSVNGDLICKDDALTPPPGIIPGTGLELVALSPASAGSRSGKARASVTALNLSPHKTELTAAESAKAEQSSGKSKDKKKALGSPRASPEGENFPMPGVGAKGPGSVHSKGSKGSGGSGTSVSDILRRGVFAKGKRLESSLILLNRAIIMAFIVVALMNIISCIVTTILYNQLIANFNRVHDAGERGLALQRVYGDTQSLQLHNSGLSPLPANGTLKVESLLANTKTYETLNLKLYAELDTQLPAEVFLYTGASTRVEELLIGQYIDYE